MATYINVPKDKWTRIEELAEENNISIIFRKAQGQFFYTKFEHNNNIENYTSFIFSYDRLVKSEIKTVSPRLAFSQSAGQTG